MSTLLIVAGIYSLGITAALIHYLHSQRTIEPILNEARSLLDDGESSIERAKVIVDIAKTENERIPWYLRSLSVIGAVGFFSMLFATGIQTVRTSIVASNVTDMESRIVELEKEKDDFDSLVSELSSAILLQHTEKGRIDEREKRVLRRRLEQIRETNSTDEVALTEKYRILLILGEYSEGIRLLDDNLGLLDHSSPADVITLAEYYYLTGAVSAARSLISEFEYLTVKLPRSVRIRAIRLHAVLTGEREENRSALASLLIISVEEADRRLEQEIMALEEARKKGDW